MASEQRASAVWKQALRIAYASSSDSTDRIDAEETARWNWLVAMAAQLELARRLKIDQSRLSYFWVELTSTGYDVAQAERAEVWIKYGDWTFKGSDPTLELSDFFPSEEQHAQSVAKVNARQAPKVATEPQTDVRAIMGAAERKWWALEYITVYEPKWGWKLRVRWIDEWRDNHAEHTLHLQNRKSVTPPPERKRTRSAAEFAEFRKRYLDADGFLS